MSVPRGSFHVIFPLRPRSLKQADQADTQPQLLQSSARTSVASWRAWLGWDRLIIAAWACILSIPPGKVTGASPVRSTLTLIERTVTQDQGAWLVDYRLLYTSQAGVVITPEDFGVKVEGWVSNSRVPGHTVPRWSSLVVSHSLELSAISEVNSAVDESQRCRERLVVSIQAEDQAGVDRRAQVKVRSEVDQIGGPVPSSPASALPLSLGPGNIIHIRLRLEHQHILYGEYDPLLAIRAVEFTLGSAVIRDVVPLNREQYLAQPKFTWPEPPADRRDTRHAISGPDSLHLEADIPGHQYYRYPERPVRYNTTMRLRFWYLIAAGTEGECRVRIAQFKDTPTSWRPLHAGDFEHCLKTIGRWTKVERIVQTESEATTLTLEFKIGGEAEVGEMWIDDVSLEPISGAGPSGP
jgi:hypothetical protein